jgi:hypothetical protein
MTHTKDLPIYLFATSQLRIFTHLFPIVASGALGVLENWEVQLFYHTNNQRISPLFLEMQ